MSEASLAIPSARRAARVAERPGRAGFVLLMILLAFDYIRPQALLPALAPLHIPLIITALLILLWLAQGDKQALRLRPVQLFALFTLLSAVSVVYAVNQYWVYRHTLSLLIYLLAVVLPMTTFVADVERFKTFVKVWLGLQLVVGLVAILQGGRGAGGFLGDENDLAVAATTAMPYAYFLAQSKDRSRLGKWLCYGVLLVLIWAVIDSDSRGGFVALLAAAMASIWYSKQRARLLVVVGLIGVIGSALVGPAYVKEMKTITNTQEATARDRLYSWRRGWEMFLDNPILGVGSGNYPWRVAEYERKSLEHRPGQRLHGGRAAHSLYFTLLPEYGLVGVLLFGTLVFSLFRRLSRLRRDFPPNPQLAFGDLDMASRAVAASMLTFFAGAAFLSMLYYPEFWVSVGIVLALEGAIRAQLREVATTRKAPAPGHASRPRAPASPPL